MSEHIRVGLGLLATALLFIPGVVLHTRGKPQQALWWLILAGALLRLFMISLDPFLHEWDERYHALVAKHMIDQPFRPLLRVDPVLAYDYTSWCCNHIWLHKQPLFLWQMAGSMALFGVNTFALRLPDVLMGAVAIYFTYRIALIWTNSIDTAWISALLYASAHFFLELSAGRYALDHNDLAFFFYATASLWAFAEYTRQPSWKYALLIGLFAGASILVKWLTGLLPFGGWFLYLLLQKDLWRPRVALQFLGALLLCVAVFLPWQLYILRTFPLEAAASYAYNVRHMHESLGHDRSILFHVGFTNILYGGPFLLFIPIGLWQAWKKLPNRALSWSFLAMIAVIYTFFSVFVKTKMGGYTIAVAALLFAVIAIGIHHFMAWMAQKTARRARLFSSVFLFLIILLSMRPWSIYANRSPGNDYRQRKLHNTAIYQMLDQQVPPDYVVLNCKELEDVELMFWQPHNAYQWFPQPAELQGLMQRGYKVAAFKGHTNQLLPEYIAKDPAIRIIELEMK